MKDPRVDIKGGDMGEPDGRSHRRERPGTQDKRVPPSALLMPTGRKGQNTHVGVLPAPLPGG